MLSFSCDYSEGAHPEILRRLLQTNLLQEPGYGEDQFCLSAKEKIRDAIGRPEAEVFFMTGGTQVNSTVIDAMTRHHEGVIAPQTGHIALHEAGAVELFGHSVITILSREGKIRAKKLAEYMEAFLADPAHAHRVQPGMVYISFPTEYGTLYSRQELADLYTTCQRYQLPLFVDGARLGYGLAGEGCDVTLKVLADLCDVFYIGGTKVGALCGEAVVFPNGEVPKGFFSIVKQHGALMAKGRLLGIQFDTLFTDNLYMKISRHAVEMAMELKKVLKRRCLPFQIESPTNQQFPILTWGQMDRMLTEVRFEMWEPLRDGRFVARFATSWATTPDQIEELDMSI